NAMYFIGMDSGICLSLLMGGIISQSLGMDIAYMVAAWGQLVSLGIFLKFVAPQYRAVLGSE
ncbi:hypothetical protein, partial [Desulfovibrio sp.]